MKAPLVSQQLNRRSVVLSVLVALAVAGFCWEAFGGSESRRPVETASNVQDDARLTGEELWSMNCQRCHNLRSAVTYSNAQWEVIVHHMRVRANLTGEEQRAIVEFLKSSK